MAAIPRPTIRSGQADGHRKAVTSPAATMATFASASLRDDRKAAPALGYPHVPGTGRA